MVKNSNYMNKKECSIFRLFIFLLFFLICGNSLADCMKDIKKQYTKDNFGYIIIDELDMLVNIFKYKNLNSKEAVNIATCRITDYKKEYITISSLQPKTDTDLKINILTQHETSSDSLRIKIKIPPICSESCYIDILPSIGDNKTLIFNEGLAECTIKKHKFIYDNLFSISIMPIINPFKSATSWGDNETLSSFNLRIDDKVDLFDPKLSEL